MFVGWLKGKLGGNPAQRGGDLKNHTVAADIDGQHGIRWHDRLPFGK